MPLRTLSQIPEGLLDCPASGLHDYLGGPTLIHVHGGREPSVFVSVLLHGNETSGWDGLRRYLREQPVPPRSLTVFVGNVAAAAAGVRTLPEQPDFNRIWRDAEGVGGAVARALQSAIADHLFFASIDLHNNTGHNPYYAVLTEVEPLNLGLAELFSDKAVYVREPDTVLTRTFTGRCPAVALEVGPVGDERCADRVVDYLGRLMELEEVPTAAVDALNLYRTRVRVHVREGIGFAFAGEHLSDPSVALLLTGGVEAVNFHELDDGVRFATSSAPVGEVLQVLDVTHEDVTDAYFFKEGKEILLRQPVVPAMYTTDPDVVCQDCLCYFMERLEPG